MTTSESKGRFFTKRIDSHNESNRELECSNAYTDTSECPIDSIGCCRQSAWIITKMSMCWNSEHVIFTRLSVML